MAGTFVGQVKVQAEVKRGHGPEFWADRCVDRLVYIADKAPDHIKEQARQFKDEMREVIYQHMVKAIMSDRRTVAITLDEAGHGDLAKMVEKL